jgi:hypothetical protein
VQCSVQTSKTQARNEKQKHRQHESLLPASPPSPPQIDSTLLVLEIVSGKTMRKEQYEKSLYFALRSGDHHRQRPAGWH